MNNTLIHDWNSYESNFDDSEIINLINYNSKKNINELKQIKEDCKLMEKYSNCWFAKINPTFMNTFPKLNKIFNRR